MAVKTFTIKDEYVPELIEAFGQGYQETVLDENGDVIANPQTKAQYANEQFDMRIKMYIRGIVMSYRSYLLEDSLNQEDITE